MKDQYGEWHQFLRPVQNEMVDYQTGVKWQMIDNQWRVAHVGDQDPNIVTDEKVKKKFREAAEQCEEAAIKEDRRKQRNQEWYEHGW